MFWLIIIIWTGYRNGGMSMIQVEKYQYKAQCEYAGEAFISNHKGGVSERNKFSYSCVPAAVNEKAQK